MVNSSKIQSGDYVLSSQYNDLRDDAVDTATGHNHVDDVLPPSAIWNEPFHDWALAFAENDDKVDMGDVLDFTGTSPFSIEAWIKPHPDMGSGYRCAVSKYDSDPDGYFFGIQLPLRRVSFSRIPSGGGGAQAWGADYAVPLGQWTHIACTYSGTSMQCYVNGVASGSPQPSTHSLADTTAALQIGNATAAGSGSKWQGNIADVRVWDDERTADEIYNNYQERLTGSEANLVGYWMLNEGTGATVTDDSSGDNEGTITGATWYELVGLDADMLDGFQASAFVQYFEGTLANRAAAAGKGHVYRATDLGDAVS